MLFLGPNRLNESLSSYLFRRPLHGFRPNQIFHDSCLLGHTWRPVSPKAFKIEIQICIIFPLRPLACLFDNTPWMGLNRPINNPRLEFICAMSVSQVIYSWPHILKMRFRDPLQLRTDDSLVKNQAPVTRIYRYHSLEWSQQMGNTPSNSWALSLESAALRFLRALISSIHSPVHLPTHHLHNMVCDIENPQSGETQNFPNRNWEERYRKKPHGHWRWETLLVYFGYQ